MFKNLKNAMMLDREFKYFVYGVTGLNVFIVGAAAYTIYKTVKTNKEKETQSFSMFRMC